MEYHGWSGIEEDIVGILGQKLVDFGGKSLDHIKKLLGGNICGLSAKEGTFVAGLFTLTTLILHMIFEVAMFVITSCGQTAPIPRLKRKLICNYVVSTGLISAGIIAVFNLFLSVWKEILWGVGGYIIWIFLYEIGQICLLTSILNFQKPCML
ncbi:transmembrane protein 217-like [Pristis pectinata]|uniref:transmembrane protein 217-like n=1 Tax=Pristis pectinata TaxID=685728 RepID=UPI00223D02F2|nr:transmembrane protein 217-like [Pristis pectinata]